MSLIKQAQQQIDQAKLIAETFVKYDVLPENATHVLANIATAANSGKPLKIMHLNSIASFMAGIDVIANSLSASQDVDKKNRTIRALSAAGIGQDGFVTASVAPIAQLGADNRERQAYYADIVNAYMDSVDTGKPNGGQLAQTARKLQQQIDQAARVSAQTPVNQMAKGVSNIAS